MNFNKKKLLFITGYTLTSFWGVLILTIIVTDPYYANDLNQKSLGYLIGAIAGLLFVLTGPLGAVFAIDRYLKSKEQKISNAVQ